MKGHQNPWKTKQWEITGVILLLGLWALLSIGESALLPPPWSVVTKALDIIKAPENRQAFFFSLVHGFNGIGVALLLGAVIGFAAGLDERLECLFRPFVAVMKTTPVMSIILLLIFWFQTDRVPAIVGFSTAFPMIYHGTIQGTRQIDRKLLEMAKVFQVPKKRQLGMLYIPALIPYLVAVLDAAIGIGWKSVIAAEVICQPRFGIGTQLMNAKYNLDMESLFAWTLLAVLVSYGLELGVRALHRRVSRWM